MKKILPVLLFALTFFSCRDQFSDKTKRNENWAWWVDAKTKKAGWIPVNEGEPVKNGKYMLFYHNGIVYKKGTLVDGTDADTVFYFDINGKLQEYTLRKKDNLSEYYFKNGPIKMYYPNGRPLAIGVVKNHGVGDRWSHFFENGRLEFIQNLKNDTGWKISYYKNSKLKDSIYYEGKNAFDIKHWYENGQLEHSSEFKNHNENGKHLQYYENGQLEAISNDVNGVPDGEQRFWFEDGKLRGTTHRKSGILNGRYVVYFEDGKIEEYIYYINGKAEGEGKKYNEQGKLIADRVFKNGVLIEDKLKVSFFPIPR